MQAGPLRVYLSSTFEDLKDYRQAVFDGLDKAGLNVARMESYPAMDRRPLQQCLTDVARSHVYVGLFAWRYGYTPPPDENPEGKSITELEYREAQRAGLQKLLFCAHPDTRSQWEARFVDADVTQGDGRKLSALREEIGRETTIAFFRSPHELSMLVLAAILRSGVAGRVFDVPPPPAGFVARPRLSKALVESLIGTEAAKGGNTVAHGGGGLGKTTLALEVCHRPEMVSAFPDGVLWITLGQTRDVSTKLASLYKSITGTAATAVGTEALADVVMKALHGRRCLLVLDDVWWPEHASMLAGLRDTRLLITTRLRNLCDQARLTNWHEVSIGEMEANEALKLLGGDVANDPQVNRTLTALAAGLGLWPILLDLVRARLLEEVSSRGSVAGVRHVTTVLERRGVLNFDLNSERREDAVARTVDAGLEFAEETSPGSARRAAELSVFPEDVSIPVAVLADLFDMEAFDVEEDVVRPLHNLSLIRWDRNASNFQLHDITRRVLAVRLGDPTAVHARLLEAWGDPLKLPHPYAWRWFGWHAAHANQIARLRTLLFDFDWLEAKLDATDVDAVIHEFDHASHASPPASTRRNEVAPEWEEGVELQRALRRAGHILGRRPELLAQQLVGRVRRDSPSSEQLVHAASTHAAPGVLLPQAPSLSTRGGVVRQVLQHAGAVACIALTGDGRLVSAGDDGCVYCVRVESGQPIVLARHEGAARHLGLTGDGRVVTAGNDGRVYCATLAGGEPRLLLSDKGSINLIALLGDGGAVVRAGFNQDVYCIRLDGGEPQFLDSGAWFLATTNDHEIVYAALGGGVLHRRSVGTRDAAEVARFPEGVTQLALTADGRRFVVGCWDGRVWCGALDGPEPPLEIAHHQREVTRLTVTADARVVSASFEGQVLCAPLQGDARPVPLALHRNGVTAVALTQDGRIVTGGFEGDVYCTSLDGGRPTKLMQHAGPVRQLVLTDDGRIVSGGWDGNVQCARLDATGAVLLGTHRGEVRQIVLTGDGGVLTGGVDGRIYWASLNPVRGAETPGVRHTGAVTDIAMAPDGQVLTSGWDGRVLRGSIESQATEVLVSHDGPVRSLLLSDDGYVITGGWDGRVYCVPPSGGQPVVIVRHAASVTHLRLTGDGRVVTAGADGFVYCARFDGGPPVALVEHKGNPISRVGGVIEIALTPDGRVVTSGWDKCLYIARLDGGEPSLIAKFDRMEVTALAVTLDGTLVIGGIGGVFCQSLNGGEVTKLEGPEGVVHSLALTGDGRVVTYGSGNRIYCGWLTGGRLLEVAQHDAAMSRTILVNGAVVWGGWDGQVRAVSLDGSKSVSLPSHQGAVEQLIPVGNGRLLSSGADGTLLLSDLQSGQTQGIFVGDVTFSPVVFDSNRSIVIAGDANGCLHTIPLPASMDSDHMRPATRSFRHGA